MIRALLLASLLAAPALSAAEVAILAYHQVEPAPQLDWATSIDDFKDQMLLLQTMGYSVVSIADAFDYLSGKKESLPPNPVVITVDDGWLDAYTTIHPALKKFGYPWSLYIYPHMVSRGRTYVTWPQVLELSRAGVDIQGHTMSHAHLMHASHKKMTDAEYDAFLTRELAESKAAIEAKTRKPVRFLAYPYGDFDDAVMAATAKHGYSAGLLSRYGLNDRKTNPLALHRFAITKETDLARFLDRGLRAVPLEMKDQAPETDSTSGALKVTATIVGAQKLDPDTVHVALLGEKAKGTFDRRTGRITITADKLTRKRQHVLVWGERASDHRRMAAAWAFTRE